MPKQPRGKLQRFFFRLVHRPTAVLMISISLLGMSFIATQRIQLDLVPDGMGSSEISINASWENANPTEIEQKIIKPLEKELRAIPNIDSIYSVAREGSAEINISFPGNVDIDEVYAEISDHVERARPLLPTEVDRIRINRRGMSSIPIMFAGVQFPDMERGVVQDYFVRQHSDNEQDSQKQRGDNRPEKSESKCFQRLSQSDKKSRSFISARFSAS